MSLLILAIFGNYRVKFEEKLPISCFLYERLLRGKGPVINNLRVGPEDIFAISKKVS